jgi:hypothetical protein
MQRPEITNYQVSVDDSTEDVPRYLTSLLGRLYHPSTTIEELEEHFDFRRRYKLDKFKP